MRETPALRCPRCEGVVRPEDLAKSFARCIECGLVFDPRRQRADLEEVGSSVGLVRESVPQPSCILVLEGAATASGASAYRESSALRSVRDLRIEMRVPITQRGLVPLLILGTALSAGILVSWALSSPVWLSLIVVWLVLMVLLVRAQRICIRLEKGHLHVEHRPIRFRGIELETHDIDQLFCRHVVQRDEQHGVERFTYNVEALLKSGHSQVLLRGILDPREALFLEQAVEGALGIEDRVVVGELMGH